MGRIIQLIHSIDNPATGPSTSVGGLCDALHARGEAVTLATLDWEEHRATADYIKRFPLSVGPRKLGLSGELEDWLRMQAKSAGDLTLHCHNLWMMPGIYASRIRKKFPNTRFVYSPRGALSSYSLASGSKFKPIFWATAQRPALAAADCLHATSAEEAEDLDALGLRRPIVTIPNGVHVPARIANPPSDTKTALYLGRIHPEKGLDALIDGWAQSVDGEWRLRIVGPDPIGYRASLERKVSDLGLDSVDFLDAAVGADKWSTLSGVEFLVLPSPSENFGIVVAEALAAGVPVLSTSGTPWSELPARGAGWYCGVSARDLADAMQIAKNLHWEERRQMGQRGRRWVESRFSWHSITDQFLSTYEWLHYGGPTPSWVYKS